MRASLFSIPSVLLILFLSLPSAAVADVPGTVRLSFLEGDVQVLLQDTTDWTDASVNVPLAGGDRLWVPGGARAELQVRGAYLRLGESTSLDVLAVNGDAVQVYLDRGHVYISTRSGGIGTVQVDTPLLSVRGYDNAVMMLDVDENGVTELSVLRGNAAAESRAGVTRVLAGNTLTVRSEQDAEAGPLDAPDEWERWNTERDRRLLAWGESSRYLPEELHEYSTELDANGSWRYAADHGYVWVPSVTVPSWAPYTVGRWIWVRGDYVWIAYDPWCWAPSHYGRWVYLSAYGWSWIPPAHGAVHWGPGYVGWVITPDYVAWVPLAPGEPYYGYGSYGPGSVNITVVNVNNVIADRVLVNARHRRAVMVVKREHFGTGVREAYRTDGNPFLLRRQAGREVAVVPPRERPDRPVLLVPPELRDREKRPMLRVPPGLRDREKRPPVEQHRAVPDVKRPAGPATPPPAVREVRPAVPPPAVRQGREQARPLPPDRVMRTVPGEVKKDRRLVKERDGSVFRQQPPAELPVKQRKEPKDVKRPGGKRSEDRKEQGDEGRRGRD